VWYKTNSQRARANAYVAKLIRHKLILAAKLLRCVRCGCKAHLYHHHLGYSEEHWGSVVPMCYRCHHKTHESLREEKRKCDPTSIASLWKPVSTPPIVQVASIPDEENVPVYDPARGRWVGLGCEGEADRPELEVSSPEPKKQRSLRIRDGKMVFVTFDSDGKEVSCVPA
jgi:hypothetical protein